LANKVGGRNDKTVQGKSARCRLQAAQRGEGSEAHTHTSVHRCCCCCHHHRRHIVSLPSFTCPPAPQRSVICEVNIKAISLPRTPSRPPPICPCPAGRGEARDGIVTDCLCFGACSFHRPSISLPTPLVCHASSLCSFRLPPPPPPPPLCLIIFLREGGREGGTDGQTEGCPSYLLRAERSGDGSVVENKHTYCIYTVYPFLSFPPSLPPSPPPCYYEVPPLPLPLSSSVLCGGRTCPISKFGQNNWRWPRRLPVVLPYVDPERGRERREHLIFHTAHPSPVPCDI